MRMLLSYYNRTPASGGVLCLVLAACLAGCASKNPLMEEPAATSTSATKPAATPDKTAEMKPASTPTASTGAQTTGPTGVRRAFGFFSPYRIDIQQGNFVSQEMVAQLKAGMTPEQVRFVLGTPLLTDMFHADRWDYLFRHEKGSGEVTTSRVTVFFKDNRVARFDGGDLPTEKDYIARIAGAAPAPKSQATAPEAAPATPPVAK